METSKRIKLTLRLSSGSIYNYLKVCRGMGFTTEEILKELNCLCDEIEAILTSGNAFISKIAKIRNIFYKYIHLEKTADSWYVRYIYKKFNMGDGKTT